MSDETLRDPKKRKFSPDNDLAVEVVANLYSHDSVLNRWNLWIDQGHDRAPEGIAQEIKTALSRQIRKGQAVRALHVVIPEPEGARWRQNHTLQKNWSNALNETMEELSAHQGGQRIQHKFILKHPNEDLMDLYLNDADMYMNINGMVFF
jgi:hypothetical protein